MCSDLSGACSISPSLQREESILQTEALEIPNCTAISMQRTREEIFNSEARSKAAIVSR